MKVFDEVSMSIIAMQSSSFLILLLFQPLLPRARPSPQPRVPAEHLSEEETETGRDRGPPLAGGGRAGSHSENILEDILAENILYFYYLAGDGQQHPEGRQQGGPQTLHQELLLLLLISFSAFDNLIKMCCQ